MTPGTLREILRHLQQWQGLFEDEGIYALTGPDGEDFCLQDIQLLYGMRYQLTPDQATAIELLLYHDMPPEYAGPASMLLHCDEGVRALCDMYNGIFGSAQAEQQLSFLDAADTGNFIDLGAGYAWNGNETAQRDLPGAGGYLQPDDRADAAGNDALRLLSK